MPSVPMCLPDGPKIRGLIWAHGYSVAAFSRKIGRRKSIRSIWRAIAGKPTSVMLLRQIAAGLNVKPGEISDFTAADGLSEPEMKVPA